MIQKLWVGRRVEVEEDCGSLEVGCTRPLRAISENSALCFRWRRCQLSRSLFRRNTEAVQTEKLRVREFAKCYQLFGEESDRLDSLHPS